MTKICIIAGNELEAYRWAQSQNLDKNCWFYPYSLADLMFKSNFHVVTVGTAGENTPPETFEKLYSLALKRGKIGRF
jgi:hypothetical protein